MSCSVVLRRNAEQTQTDLLELKTNRHKVPLCSIQTPQPTAETRLLLGRCPWQRRTCIPGSGTVGGARAAPAQDLGKRDFQMASMDQTQCYREGCALCVSQVSQKGTSTEQKYSYDDTCAAIKNNPSTGKKHRTAVTTYFCIATDKKSNTKKGIFLDHRVLKLITSTKENAFPPSRCLCHLPGDERNMKPQRRGHW